MSQTVALRCADAYAGIATRGAEARAWSVGGVDLLWPGDPAIWDAISPVLFPIVGWTRDGVQVAGKRHPLGVHGFAARLAFTVTEQSADHVRLEARDDATTLALYPFAFRLALTYRLTPDALNVAIDVANPGDRVMPYACGLHPGFRWPFAGGGREGAFVRFARPERAEVPVIAPGGLISSAMRRLPLLEGVRLPLDDALFASEAACFLNLNSRSISFRQANGAAIAMDFPGFSHAALWSRPGAPFLSMEAWTGYGDPEGFDGELSQKPSMRMLEPQAKARHEAAFRFIAP